MATVVPRDVLAGWPVLVIDDDPDSLEIGERILRFYGAQVTTATDGYAALGHLQLPGPAFILCDLSMPGMDGWTFLRTLRQMPGGAAIPVVALTAHAKAADEEQVLAAGFDACLHKPITPATFMHDLLRRLQHIPALVARLSSR
ncbi:MAG: response regulator [Anaerolineae bacterium]|nr:response regulator [Anaerolineae bacterium]